MPANPPPEVLRQMRQSARLSRSDAGSFHLGLRVFPCDQRRAMHVIYRFCRLVDDAVDEPGRSREEKQAALTRIEDQFTGKPDEEPWRALRWIRSHYQIPDVYFFDLIEGARSDLGSVRLEDYEQLRCYCYRVAGTVGLMTLHIMGFRDRRALQFSRAMGEAFQLTNILRDVKDDRNQDRCYLPRTWLDNEGARSDWQEGNDSPELRAVCRDLGRRARIRYRQSLALFPLVEPDCRFALALMTGVYSWYLSQMESRGFLPEPGALSLPRRNLPRIIWRSWRAARGRADQCLLIA